jgi:hypothetical protein
MGRVTEARRWQRQPVTAAGYGGGAGSKYLGLATASLIEETDIVVLLLQRADLELDELIQLREVGG